MHSIHLHKTKFTIPSRWDELSKKQLIQIASLNPKSEIQNHKFEILNPKSKIQNPKSKILTPVATAKLLFLILTMSLPWWKKQYIRFFYFFSSTIDEKGDLIFLTRSFHEFPQFTAQKIEKIYTQIVPFSTKLHGPHSKLANCTFWEYILAEKYFLEYMRSGSEEFLNKLIAVIYRPGRRDYNPDIHEDLRYPLIDSAIPHRAKQIAKLTLPLRLAILMWFDGCRTMIVHAFPDIYPKPKPSEPTLSDKLQIPTPKNNGGWIDLISQLSTTMLDFQSIGNTNLTIALTDISKRMQRAKNQPKPVKKSR